MLPDNANYYSCKWCNVRQVWCKFFTKIFLPILWSGAARGRKKNPETFSKIKEILHNFSCLFVCLFIFCLFVCLFVCLFIRSVTQLINLSKLEKFCIKSKDFSFDVRPEFNLVKVKLFQQSSWENDICSRPYVAWAETKDELKVTSHLGTMDWDQGIPASKITQARQWSAAQSQPLICDSQSAVVITIR